MDEWSYKDIPIADFQVIAEPNPVTGEIKLITKIAGKIKEEYLQTRDEQLRNALIDLGWRPPPQEPWKCDNCNQLNADWADTCGRCHERSTTP